MRYSYEYEKTLLCFPEIFLEIQICLMIEVVNRFIELLNRKVIFFQDCNCQCYVQSIFLPIMVKQSCTVFVQHLHLVQDFCLMLFSSIEPLNERDRMKKFSSQVKNVRNISVSIR